jgi:hypothetical protein
MNASMVSKIAASADARNQRARSHVIDGSNSNAGKVEYAPCLPGFTPSARSPAG